MLVVLRTRAVAYAAAGPARGRRSRDLRELEKRGALSAEDAVVLGDNLRLAGHAQEAVAVLERTSRENPKFAQPLLSLAAVLVQQKRHGGGGARPTQKVLAVDPDNAEALRGLGRPRASSRATWPRPASATRGSWSSTRTDAGALTKLGVVQGADGTGRRGDRPPAPGRRARPEERRGPPLPRGRPRLERPPGGGRALLRAGPRRGPPHDDGAQRPRPHAAASSATGRARPRRSASRCASTRPAGRGRRPAAARPALVAFAGLAGE